MVFGLKEKLFSKDQFRSVIEWKPTSANELFFQWSTQLNEIKNASKLIVSPGQGCFVVYQGKVVAHHSEAGMYELKTDNIPFWTTLTKIMQAFESEHKVGLYFYRSGDILDQKWGTTSLVKYEDPKYKFPVSLKSFGNFSIKISEPENFFVNVVSSRASFNVDELRPVICARIMTPLRDAFAESKKGYNEIDSCLEEIGADVKLRAAGTVKELGFALTDFRIEGTSFDEGTQKRIEKIADATADALANQALGVNYIQKEQLGALRDAAKNESGAAGIGMSIGAGVQATQALMGMMNANPMIQQQPAAPASTATQSPTEKLKAIKDLLDAGLITQEDFAQKKAEILKSI